MATRIYVGNLPYTTDDQQLVELFAVYGDVTEATVVMDRDSGRSKGFGFVQMASDDAARNAIVGLNGTMVGNRTIRVSEAQPRAPRSGGSRYGDSYGGGYGGGYDARPRYESGYRAESARGGFDAREERWGRGRSRGW